MDIFCSEPAERGLSRYVEAVATSLNVPRDVALLWDAEQGWSMTMETHSGEDLILLGYLTTDLLPNPRAVVAFARDILAGNGSGQRRPPPPFEDTDLRQRLADYARDLEEHPGIRSHRFTRPRASRASP